MHPTFRIALMSASLLLWGVQAGTPAAAADEHDRGRAEPRQEPRGQPGPRPDARRPEGGRQEGWRPDAGRASFDGRGQRLDSRYNHGRYYPPRGSVMRSLPDGYRPYYRGGSRYYFSGGIWYAPRGPEFVVVSPPPGLVISTLPPYYSTVWIGGVPYYYADDVYYTWQPDQNAYAVVDPPANADAPSPPPTDGAQSDLIIYPKNGQTKEQQAADQFECHDWAKGQTGFDPTQPGGGVSDNPDAARSNYNRAMSACLQGRGYQVN
jgi:hypothetical protein